jgi:hypothetical protein
MEVNSQRYAPTALTPKEIGNLYPLNTRLGGSQSQVCTFWRDENILLSLPKIEPRFRGCTSRASSLYRQSYRGSCMLIFSQNHVRNLNSRLSVNISNYLCTYLFIYLYIYIFIYIFIYLFIYSLLQDAVNIYHYMALNHRMISE